MVSMEEMHTPAPAAGCVWAATKVLIILAALLLFFLGLFAGIFVSMIANSLM
jgi:hypothetical protein